MTAQGAFSCRKPVNLDLASLETNISRIALITRGVVNRDVAQEMVEVFNRKSGLDCPLRIFRGTTSAMR